LDPIAQPLLDEGKAIEKQALTAIKTAVDSILDNAKTEVPKISGDALTFAEQWIEKNVTGLAGTFLKSAIGFGDPIVRAELPVLTAAAVAGISNAQKVVDAHLAAITG